MSIARLLSQAKTPTGRLGRLIARFMNIEHSILTDWALDHVSIGRNDTILDVGCGGGRTVGKLARMAPQGRISGVDISDESIAVARRANMQSIKTGQVEILQAAVSNLPFADNSFNLVTAVETYYFWPDLIGDMQEIARVLKPGGRLMIVAESYKGSKRAKQWENVMKVGTQEIGMTHLDEKEFRNAFAAAGFEKIKVETQPQHGWICSIGNKSDSRTQGQVKDGDGL